MSRCRACNKILTIPEMSSDNDGMCRNCVSLSFDEYDVIYDKDYVGGVMDGISVFDEIKNINE